MRILLVGEFSGVHHQLMEQLQKNGHNCDLISDGDGWKGFKSTIELPKRKKVKKWNKFLFPFLDFFGLAGIREYTRIHEILSSLPQYDVIQFINPVAIKSLGALGNLLLFKRLQKITSNTYLCALGGDFNVEKFYLANKLKYSPWNGFNFKSLYYYYQNCSFFFPGYLFLQLYIQRNVKKIIPGLYEYYLSYAHCEKRTEIINLPINTEDYNCVECKNNEKIKIFYSKKPHRGDYFKKGYAFFDEALEMLQKDGLPFELITANGVPFEIYKKMLSDCDVLLDQTLSYDRGMSGLIGMANGMITFSGNEREVQEYYGRDIPCINAIPDSQYIYEKLKHIISHKYQYNQMRVDAQSFVREYHSADVIALKYLSVWTEA